MVRATTAVRSAPLADENADLKAGLHALADLIDRERITCVAVDTAEDLRLRRYALLARRMATGDPILTPQPTED